MDIPSAKNFLRYLISSYQMEQLISVKNTLAKLEDRLWAGGQKTHFLWGSFETDMPLRPCNKPFSSFPFFLMSSLDEIK